jgi:hypothetical protein
VETGADAARDTPTDARPSDGGETTNPPGVQISLVPALSRGAAVRFAITFALLCGVLLGLYYFPYSEGGRIRPVLDGFLHRYAASAGLVLRWFEPRVQVIGQDIIGRYSLRIVKTCDAMDVTILLMSAIVAWPSTKPLETPPGWRCRRHPLALCREQAFWCGPCTRRPRPR